MPNPWSESDVPRACTTVGVSHCSSPNVKCTALWIYNPGKVFNFCLRFGALWLIWSASKQ